MKKSVWLVGLVCVMAAMAAQGAEQAEPSSWLGESIDYSLGADVRIRQIYFDEIPIVADPPGVTRGGDNHFFRFRTRVWEQLDIGENVTLRGRIVNEFRHYEEPDNDTMDALDEIVVDQLYLDLKNLMNDKVDLRIGRQDIIYGTGKVILEGTPKDGSRTIYHDAVKLTYKGMEKTTVDLFGIYNQPENELVIDSQERDLTGQTAAFDDITESGGGIYIKDKCIEAMPLELYYVYKNESDWDGMRGTNAFSVDELDLNTVGFRLMPKWTDQIDANVEVAYQFGERGDQDVDGMMVDAVARYHVPALGEMKPCIGAGIYYLSGDDPSTGDDEGWNPLWARWPQYSELYIYAFDADGAGRWSNVSMPHVDLSISLHEKVQTKAMVGLLTAPEENGPGGGDERGWLFTIRNDFQIAKGLLADRDSLSGHLLLEVLEPGDYYNVDDTAYFARWELTYAF